MSRLPTRPRSLRLGPARCRAPDNQQYIGRELAPRTVAWADDAAASRSASTDSFLRDRAVVSPIAAAVLLLGEAATVVDAQQRLGAAAPGQPGPDDRICRRDCSAAGGETGACSFTADAGRRVGRQGAVDEAPSPAPRAPLCPREPAVDRGHAARAPTADPLRRQRGSRRPRSRPRLRGEDGTFVERAHSRRPWPRGV